MGTETSEGISLITVIAWMIANSLCAPSLVFACCTREKFRVLIYIPFTFHLCALGVIMGEMLARPLSGVNIIIVSMMQILALVIVYRIPRAFRIDEKRLNVEQSRRDQEDSAKYSLVNNGRERHDDVALPEISVKTDDVDKTN